ncbi:glycine betaine/L-proline ABC transporter ATP-binding protein [Saccharicrinis sp. FJH2]|uniref:quaternary amine ABC transporter ATP-binding protein n=1 Tax=unclassified Saccharicrinis TaxID=2646859 RepID=UPI0035D402A5
MIKVKIEDLSLIFGKRKKEALSLLKQGASKQEILEKTNCTMAVKNANLEIKEAEVFVIMGLSGSGKSTLLRCINRLINPTAGDIWVNDNNITRSSDKELLEIRRKEFAMVFQHFGLLPHRTVMSNVAFGLELQGVDKDTRNKKALDTIKLVGLEGYEDMKVSELSGGMQQRVGLARGLANDPEVLLMDEAFSALDPLIRAQMQDELLILQEKMKKTIIFITHDLDEAIKIGDRIAIMKDGEIVQVGTSEEILTDPANDYVRDFVENVDRGKIITAGSVMFRKPTIASMHRDGPEVVIKKMRDKGLDSIPVVRTNRTFVGVVTIQDALKCKKEGKKSIESVVNADVPSVNEDATVEDMLPLVTESVHSIPVVDEENHLLGVVTHTSILVEVTGKDKKEIQEIIQNAIDL